MHVLHCVDEASMFHLGRRLAEGKEAERTLNAWQEFWMSWAGSPSQVYLDPASEFPSGAWISAPQEMNIETFATTGSWQKGKVACHGKRQ